MDINVTVNNICLLNPDTLNSGEAYIHKLNFNFSEEYTSDLVYRACFTCLSGTYVSPILNNECEIPPEVLENEGIIELGVYAYILEDNTLIKRFSPEHIFIKIIAGSYREGLESEAPTPTEQEQWLNAFNRNYLNKIELFNENAATKTQEFTDVADKAASDINNVVEKLEEDVASHVYDGATFIPNVDTEGNISWTNNQDFPNPETRNIRGPQGPQGETGPVGPAGAIKIRMVDELPDVSEAEEGVLYFVPKEETETAEDLYEEYVFTDGRYEFIGSRHISIDLTDYVKFTDYGTGQKAGVLKTGNSLSINGTGQPVAIERTYEQYTAMSNNNFIGKGTLENFAAGRNLETANNKVTEINENSTDTEYPSAKAVYNSIKDFSTEEELLSENSTENVEGTELEIDNTIDSRIKLNKLGGNTSQETTEGYNLADYSDNYISGNLSNYGAFNLTLNNSFLIDVTKTYYFSADVRRISGSGITKMNVIRSTNTSGQVTNAINNPNMTSEFQRYVFSCTYTAEQTLTQVAFQILTEQSTVIEVKNIMISTTNTEYEPYTGNLPSPSPDFPQEVKVVKGENVVSVQGKNLFDKENYPSGYVLSQSVAEYTPINRGTYIEIKANTTYTVSKIPTSRFRIATAESIPTANSPVNCNKYIIGNASSTELTITSTANDKYLIVNYHDGNTLYDINDIINSLQIEENSTATDYQPYSKTDYPINLGSLELCKINDYADYIYRDNGKWYVHKEINKKDIENISSFIRMTSALANNLYGYALNLVDSNLSEDASLGIVNSNLFISKILGTASDEDNINNVRFNMGIAKNTNSRQLVITIDKSYLSTGSIEEIRDFLTNNNFYYYCVLATPTEEEITDTTLLSQLEDFYNAKTLQAKTIISQENEELPFVLNLDYFTNSIAGNIAGVNYNVDTLIADIEKALEEINGESVGG